MSLVETDFIKPIHKKERLTCQPQETELGNKEYKIVSIVNQHGQY